MGISADICCGVGMGTEYPVLVFVALLLSIDVGVRLVLSHAITNNVLTAMAMASTRSLVSITKYYKANAHARLCLLHLLVPVQAPNYYLRGVVVAQ